MYDITWCLYVRVYSLSYTSDTCPCVDVLPHAGVLYCYSSLSVLGTRTNKHRSSMYTTVIIIRHFLRLGRIYDIPIMWFRSILKTSM